MSTYYAIGCEKCRERACFLRESMAGFGWMGGAIEEVPEFVQKHLALGCVEHLRIFSEHDWRYDDYAEFAPDPTEEPAEALPPTSPPAE